MLETPGSRRTLGLIEVLWEDGIGKSQAGEMLFT